MVLPKLLTCTGGWKRVGTSGRCGKWEVALLSCDESKDRDHVVVDGEIDQDLFSISRPDQE